MNTYIFPEKKNNLNHPFLRVVPFSLALVASPFASSLPREWPAEPQGVAGSCAPPRPAWDSCTSRGVCRDPAGSTDMSNSIDWLKGKIAGQSHDLHGKIYGFRFRFSLKSTHWAYQWKWMMVYLIHRPPTRRDLLIVWMDEQKNSSEAERCFRFFGHNCDASIRSRGE